MSPTQQRQDQIRDLPEDIQELKTLIGKQTIEIAALQTAVRSLLLGTDHASINARLRDVEGRDAEKYQGENLSAFTMELAKLKRPSA